MLVHAPFNRGQDASIGAIMARQRVKRGGRRKRLAQRAAKPAIDPCPPGQVGGVYKPLTDADLRRIYDTALDLLEKLGIGEVPDRLQHDLLAIGATDNGQGRFLFPPSLVEEAIDQAAKTFTLHGRDPSRSIEVGGEPGLFRHRRSCCSNVGYGYWHLPPLNTERSAQADPAAGQAGQRELVYPLLCGHRRARHL